MPTVEIGEESPSEALSRVGEISDLILSSFSLTSKRHGEWHAKVSAINISRVFAVRVHTGQVEGTLPCNLGSRNCSFVQCDFVLR